MTRWQPISQPILNKNSSSGWCIPCDTWISIHRQTMTRSLPIRFGFSPDCLGRAKSWQWFCCAGVSWRSPPRCRSCCQRRYRRRWWSKRCQRWTLTAACVPSSRPDWAVGAADFWLLQKCFLKNTFFAAPLNTFGHWKRAARQTSCASWNHRPWSCRGRRIPPLWGPSIRTFAIEGATTTSTKRLWQTRGECTTSWGTILTWKKDFQWNRMQNTKIKSCQSHFVRWNGLLCGVAEPDVSSITFSSSIFCGTGLGDGAMNSSTSNRSCPKTLLWWRWMSSSNSSSTKLLRRFKRWWGVMPGVVLGITIIVIVRLHLFYLLIHP